MQKTLLYSKFGVLVTSFVYLVYLMSGNTFYLNQTISSNVAARLETAASGNLASALVAENAATAAMLIPATNSIVDPVDSVFSDESVPSEVVTLAAASSPAVLPAGCVADMSAKKVLTISPSDNPAFTPAQKFACMKAKIETASKGQTIMFQAGTYFMSPDVTTFGKRSAADVAIMVPSGVTVRGAGPSKTIFKLTNPKYPLLFRLSPVRPGLVFATTSLQRVVPKGSSIIVVRADQGPVAYFEIIQPNDVSYINSLYEGTLIARFGSLEAIPTIRTFHGKFTRQAVLADGSAQYILETIAPVSPGMMTVRTTIPHTFAAGTVVRTVPPVTDVILQDFAIEGSFVGYPNAAVKNSDFSNVADMSLVQANSFAAILVDYANETVQLKNIAVTYPWSRGVEIKRSVGTKVRDIKVTGAHNKGGGGNGYGITLSGSTNIDATDLVILNTRHGFVFNAEDSEHFNFVKIADINRDINFHGLLDSGNVVSVGTMHQEYDVNANATWAAVHFDQARNHVPTVRVDNTVYFSNVSASRVSFNGDPTRQNDWLYAAPGGGKILGQLGNDMIFGSASNDFLNGGVGQDTVRGGEGADEVTGGPDNDKLYGEGNNDLISAGDGDDVVDGGDGDDKIIGGLGKDDLTGGLGRDVFTYGYLAESVVGTADIIKDFSVNEDMLDLSRSGYTSNSLQSTYDGTYTKIFTKNHKNSFEVWLVGNIPLASIKLAPAAVADENKLSVLMTFLDLARQ